MFFIQKTYSGDIYGLHHASVEQQGSQTAVAAQVADQCNHFALGFDFLSQGHFQNAVNQTC